MLEIYPLPKERFGASRHGPEEGRSVPVGVARIDNALADFAVFNIVDTADHEMTIGTVGMPAFRCRQQMPDGRCDDDALRIRIAVPPALWINPDRKSTRLNSS